MPQLNPQQKAAVEYVDGPLLVLAGAGSGKTRVITHKLAFLLAECGLGADRVAAITFTRKAAREMQGRAAKLLRRRRAGELQVCTFHALGWRMLREHGDRLGYARGISILDETESLRVLRELVPGSTPNEQITLGRRLISDWKNAAIEPEQAAASAEHAFQQRLANWYAMYCEQLAKMNAVDFDDLIGQPLRLLRSEETRELWRQRLRHVLVDEYQDTNETQYQLLRELVGGGGGLTAVGDDDQSIYGWRGARPENIEQLGQDYPDLRVIKLEQNYRSTTKLLRAANSVIANNPHVYTKQLWSALGEGDDLRVLPCPDDENEASRIAAEIHTRVQNGARLSEFAILYRGHHLSRPLERALREAGIRYHLTGGRSFFDRAEIRDLLGYLRLLVNPSDNSAFLRVLNTPRRELGQTTAARIAQHAARCDQSLYEAALADDLRTSLGARQRAALDQLMRTLVMGSDEAERGGPMAAVDQVIEDIRYREWLREQADNPEHAERMLGAVDELLGWLRRIGGERAGGEPMTLAGLLAHIQLAGVLDEEDGDAGEAVRLMTLHAAKGLEFPHVYLVGAEEGLLPHQNSIDDGMEAEERRLFYVGITRAQRSLAISYCKHRRRRGQQHPRKPSRFLAELPEDGIHWLGRSKRAESQEEKAAGAERLRQLQAMLDG